MTRWASWCRWEDSLRLLSSGGGGSIRGRPFGLTQRGLVIPMGLRPPGLDMAVSRAWMLIHTRTRSLRTVCPQALQFILRLACWEGCCVSMGAHIANRIPAFSPFVFIPQSGSVSSYDNSIFNFFLRKWFNLVCIEIAIFFPYPISSNSNALRLFY